MGPTRSWINNAGKGRLRASLPSRTASGSAMRGRPQRSPRKSAPSRSRSNMDFHRLNSRSRTVFAQKTVSGKIDMSESSAATSTIRYGEFAWTSCCRSRQSTRRYSEHRRAAATNGERAPSTAPCSTPASVHRSVPDERSGTSSRTVVMVEPVGGRWSAQTRRRSGGGRDDRHLLRRSQSFGTASRHAEVGDQSVGRRAGCGLRGSPSAEVRMLPTMRRG